MLYVLCYVLYEIMLAIRLSRFGKKKMPTYRVIVSEKTKDPWGDYLEKLGHYNPRDKKIELNLDRVKYWLSKGAKPSDTVYNLLVSQGVLDGKKKTVTRIAKKRKLKIDEKNKVKTEKVKAEKTVEQLPAVDVPTQEIKTDEPKKETPAEPVAVEAPVEVTPKEPVVETPTTETK